MSSSKRAGALNHRVRFEQPVAQSDGAGGQQNGFAELMVCAANVQVQRGGETVMAGRLAGKNAAVISVRLGGQQKNVTTECRVVDVRSGEIFNIRSKIVSADRRWVDYLCESGVATN